MNQQYGVAPTALDLERKVKLLRYMGLVAFLSLLQRKEEWFVRLSKLEDPYEGVFPATMR